MQSFLQAYSCHHQVLRQQADEQSYLQSRGCLQGYSVQSKVCFLLTMIKLKDSDTFIEVNFNSNIWIISKLDQFFSAI